MGVSNELLAPRPRSLDAMETKFFVRSGVRLARLAKETADAELIGRDVVAFAERRAMLAIQLKGPCSLLATEPCRIRMVNSNHHPVRWNKCERRTKTPKQFRMRLRFM